jgi:hypothetical protein
VYMTMIFVLIIIAQRTCLGFGKTRNLARIPRVMMT